MYFKETNTKNTNHDQIPLSKRTVGPEADRLHQIVQPAPIHVFSRAPGRCRYAKMACNISIEVQSDIFSLQALPMLSGLGLENYSNT